MMMMMNWIISIAPYIVYINTLEFHNKMRRTRQNVTRRVAVTISTCADIQSDIKPDENEVRSDESDTRLINKILSRWNRHGEIPCFECTLETFK